MARGGRIAIESTIESQSIPSIDIEIEPSISGIDRIDFDRIDIESIIEIVPYRFRYQSRGGAPFL